MFKKHKLNGTMIHDLKDVVRLIKNNIKAFNDRNINAYMSTLIKSDDEFLRNYMVDIFSNYDVRVELLDMKLNSYSPEIVKIQCIQITRGINCFDFKNNRTIAVHYIRKIGHRWLIDKTLPKQTTYI